MLDSSGRVPGREDAAPLAPRLIAGLTAEWPLLDLRLAPVGPSLPDALGEVRFGVVGRRGHPALGRALTTERWLAYGHVITRFGKHADQLD